MIIYKHIDNIIYVLNLFYFLLNETSHQVFNLIFEKTKRMEVTIAEGIQLTPKILK